MGVQKNATYKVHNGIDFDEIHFKTNDTQVTCSDGRNLKTNLLGMLKRTTADMQIYVKLTGNDTTGDGSYSKPYRTIQKAIDSLPKYVEHIVTINIDAGDYAETIGVNGFIGRGEIRILGAATSADTHVIASIQVTNCACPVFITGLRATRISSANFNVEYCQFVKFNYCKAINGADQSAFRFLGSKGMTEFCEVRNRQYALLALRSEVYSSEWFSNSGNNVYGLYASEGGKISKFGTQPTGTTANETSIKGGQIM